MDEVEIGTKVKYVNEAGKVKTGVIFAVRQREESDGTVTHRSFLIDTGKDFATEERVFDHRDIEVSKRINELVENDVKMTVADAMAIVETHDDLPDSKVEVEVIRQPEQIELTYDQFEVVNNG